jgi:hypothetical protein
MEAGYNGKKGDGYEREPLEKSAASRKRRK